MLFAVLLLVLVALGLLVPALTTSSTSWAWSSVGASGLAAVVLALDWWRHRRRAAGDQPPAPVAGDASPAPERARASDEDAEPAEEETDAADLLVVADLTDEVRVLDERPRYHLAGCTWLGERSSLGLPVAEARQLGFTPCGVCLPDSTLATAQRASS